MKKFSAEHVNMFSSKGVNNSVLINHGDAVGAEQIIESAGQQRLNVVACDGLHHPEASLEIGIEVSPDMHLALPARRDGAALDLRLSAGVASLTGSGVTRPLLVFSSCLWMSAILDMSSPVHSFNCSRAGIFFGISTLKASSAASTPRMRFSSLTGRLFTTSQTNLKRSFSS